MTSVRREIEKQRGGLTRKREKREREKEQGVSTSKVRPLLFHIAFI
jgi:hypothetical protein